MKNSFEIAQDRETELTSEEKFNLAKKKHPDPRSFMDKIKHSIQEAAPVQDWLEKRAENMVKESGVNEVIEGYDAEEKIRIADIGGGTQHIEKEIIKNNPGKNVSTVGIDLKDYASGAISGSGEGKKINTVFGSGQELPIKEKSVDVATSFFTFQELSHEDQEKMLDEMIRIIKDDGKIIIVDEPPQGMTEEGIFARAKNILRNVNVSEYNVHSGEEWRDLFEKKGLKIVDKKEFREDGKEVDEKNPAQFFSYIVEKAEKKIEN
ncbi:MAG: class I SAM-dependent methyltransferase [Candidatus Paceibacterota bacterium]|jgi:ubiquinone/menaquinone biosynthesis C-methylase UbiE